MLPSQRTLALDFRSVGKSVSCRQTPGYNHLSRCVSKEIMKGVYSQMTYEEQSLRSAAKNHKAGCYMARTAKQQWWPGDQWVSFFLCSVKPSWRTWKLASSLGGTKGNCVAQVLTSHSYKTENQDMKPHGSPWRSWPFHGSVRCRPRGRPHCSFFEGMFLPPSLETRQQRPTKNQRGCPEGRDSHAFLHMKRHPANSFPTMLLSAEEGCTFCCQLADLYSERSRD